MLTPEHERLVRKLESIGTVTDAEKAALGELPLDIRTFRENVDVLQEGDRPTHSCLLVEGLVCRYKLMSEGQRQIFSFHTAGDFLDLQSLELSVQDHSVSTLTPTTVGFVPQETIRRLMVEHPGVGRLFWRDTLVDAAIFREWLANVGRRTAHARIAHLLCELFCRMKAVGLVDDRTMTLPITQVELGDAIGLSSVHVNRVLQDLRRDGLIESLGHAVKIIDWPGLERAGEFDPAYLHIRKAA